MTMTTMSIAEAKAHLSEVIKRVNGEHDRVTVTVHGKPAVVMLAVEDLEALEMTLEILSEPDTMARLAESEAELARGESYTLAQLNEFMATRLKSQA